MFKPGDDETKAAGRRMMERVKREDEAARRAIVDGIVRDLGRPATAAELVKIEAIAAAAVKARRLRNRGRDDLVCLQVIASLSATLGKTLEPATA